MNKISRKANKKKLKRKRFEKLKKGGTISVEIDELTSCLKRIRDGKIVKTYFVNGLPSEEHLLEWEFDWQVEIENGFEVKQLFVEGDDRIQGMIAYRKREDYMAIEVDIVEAAPFNNPHHPNFVSKEYLGVGGHLFAEATRISFLYGFDGFVKFKAKNDLLFHYQNTLGAIQIGNTQNMYINEEGARKLYERYYKESIFIR